MKIQYEHTNLRAKTLKRIAQINEIVAEYQAQGFMLTLRQLYYQFVARGLVENNLTEYGKIGDALNSGRMCGLIDWAAIEDRTRQTYENSHWSSPHAILEAAADGYGIDTRATQEYYIEVWIEKNALLGVIEPVCQRLDVLYLPCIGYYSLSSMWRAANRFNARKKPCIIFHLGDHDPSGIDMTRDIKDRLDKFGATHVDVRRIALNMAQVKKYSPPPNPANFKDSRSSDYVAKYGKSSWELDALSPKVISDLIEKHVDDLTDIDELCRMRGVQEDHQEILQIIADEHEDE